MPNPTGTIQLQQDGVDIPGANGVLDDAGNYSITFAGLAAGADNITAVYSGDANWNPKVSAVLVQQVNAPLGDVNVTLGGDPNPSVVGSPVVFSGNVASV